MGLVCPCQSSKPKRAKGEQINLAAQRAVSIKTKQTKYQPGSLTNLNPDTPSIDVSGSCEPRIVSQLDFNS